MTSTEVAFDTSCKIEHASRKRYDRLENAQKQVLMSVQLGGGHQSFLKSVKMLASTYTE
jgi:hypothetical protein